MKLIGLEYFKLRRKNIAMMIVLFLSAEMLWACLATAKSIASHPDQAVWESILFMVITLNGLFLPMMSAIIVSRICDMEHKGATWKTLAAANVSRCRLYAAKYICANGLLLFGIIVQTVCIVAFGVFQGFPKGIPVAWLFQFIGGTMLTALAITALQQWISMTVHNQAFALCLGMLGGFLGMTAGLFPAQVRHLFIWAYFLELSPVTVQYAESTASYLPQPIDAKLWATALAMAIMFYIAGNIHMTRKEI